MANRGLLNSDGLKNSTALIAPVRSEIRIEIPCIRIPLPEAGKLLDPIKIVSVSLAFFSTMLLVLLYVGGIHPGNFVVTVLVLCSTGSIISSCYFIYVQMGGMEGILTENENECNPYYRHP